MEKKDLKLCCQEENIRADKTDNRYFKVPLDSRDLDYTEYFESVMKKLSILKNITLTIPKSFQQRN